MHLAATNHPRAASGFTLVELLLANLVLIVGLLSIAALAAFSLSSHYTSRIEAAALQFSQEKLEELRSFSMDDSRLSGPGCALDSLDEIDFTSAAAAHFSAQNELVLNITRNSRVLFETRWNITDFGNQKVITVATRSLAGSSSGLKPVSLKIIKGI
jgi:type II secretory pathway pseudopilin PulG